MRGMSSYENGRRGRRERPNDPGLLILTSLASGEKHGYALLLDIEAFTGVRLGPGTLYGAIGRLEERGLIEPAGAEGRARPYRLTHGGQGDARVHARRPRQDRGGGALAVARPRGGPGGRRRSRVSARARRGPRRGQAGPACGCGLLPAQLEGPLRGGARRADHAMSGEAPLPWRTRIDLVRAGLRERARGLGFGGQGVPAGERARAGALLVLCAWAIFLVGGAILQRFAENWQS